MMALAAAGLACGCSFDPSGSGQDPGQDGDPDRPGDAAGDDVDAAFAPTADAAGPVMLRISAQIDGRSQLRLSGNTAQWFHIEFAAPGRHGGGTLPTMIDGIAWFPVWPDDPDEENRDCGCLSDVATVIDPPLPEVPSVATLTAIEVRIAAAIVQQPGSDNGFTTVVEFDDTGEGGSDTYVVDVEVAPTVE